MTAYHKYLLRESQGNKEHLAGIIFMDLYEQNPQAYELLGDKTLDLEKPLECKAILEEIAQTLIDKQ
jgi:hypothetical protein